MVFEQHSELEGLHAFLSPSQYHWINYTEQRLRERVVSSQAAEIGTELHEWASKTIRLNRLQPRNNDMINKFINDAIGYKMLSEQPLFYSWNCFGTADAISYRKNVLRISDLKTGVSDTHFEQLRIYAALFCLEYQRKVGRMRLEGASDIDIADKLDVNPKELHFDPMQIDAIILRIYQVNCELREEIADPNEIKALMDIIVADNAIIREMKSEV